MHGMSLFIVDRESHPQIRKYTEKFLHFCDTKNENYDSVVFKDLGTVADEIAL